MPSPIPHNKWLASAPTRLSLSQRQEPSREPNFRYPILAFTTVLVMSTIIRSPRSLFTQKLCSTTTSWWPDYFAHHKYAVGPSCTVLVDTPPFKSMAFKITYPLDCQQLPFTWCCRTGLGRICKHTRILTPVRQEILCEPTPHTKRWISWPWLGNVTWMAVAGSRGDRGSVVRRENRWVGVYLIPYLLV